MTYDDKMARFEEIAKQRAAIVDEANDLARQMTDDVIDLLNKMKVLKESTGIKIDTYYMRDALESLTDWDSSNC